MKKHKTLTIFLVILIIKLLSLTFLITISQKYNPDKFFGIASYAGDAGSYIDPMENYITKGKFSYSGNDHTVYRTPYYGIPYFFFRLFLNKTGALSSIVILQFLLEILSIFLLFKLVSNLFKSRWGPYLFLAFVLVSFHTSDFTYRILSESLSMSFLIISIYLFYHFIKNQKIKHLLIGGLFFAFTVLLKPYFGLFYLAFGLSLLFFHKEKPWPQSLSVVSKQSVLFFLPLFFLSLPWTIRNYIHFDRLIPFNEYAFDELELSYRHFARARGESYVYWDHETAGCYFIRTNQPCYFKIEESFLSQNASLDEIEDVRKKFFEYQDQTQKDPILKEEIITSFNLLTENYRNDKPFQYYVVSRLRLAKYFLLHSGSYYLPYTFNEVGFILKGIKLLQSLMYYIVLLSVLGSIILLFKKKSLIFLFATPLFLILFFPLIFGATEYRFFAHFYPFSVIGIIYFIESLMKKHKLN